MTNFDKESVTKTKFYKDFDKWNDYKKSLENKTSDLKKINYTKTLPITIYISYNYREGEVWYASVGINLGTEICGKNENFSRPVLILKKFGKNFICLPLTSVKPKNVNFYEDISYFDQFKEIYTESYVLLTIPKSFDIIRLVRRIRRLKDFKFEEIKNRFKSLL